MTPLRRRGTRRDRRNHPRHGRSHTRDGRRARAHGRVDAAGRRGRELLRRRAGVAGRGRTAVHGCPRTVRDGALVDRRRHAGAAHGCSGAGRRGRLPVDPRSGDGQARRTDLPVAHRLRGVRGRGRRPRGRTDRPRFRLAGADVRTGRGSAAIDAPRGDEARLAGRRPGRLPGGRTPRPGRRAAPARRAGHRHRRRLRPVTRHVHPPARGDVLLGHVHTDVRVVLRCGRPGGAVLRTP